MAYVATACVYHPNVGAASICERCRRPICLNDQRMYRKSRSRGSGSRRRTWTETYMYCIACNADTLRSDASGSIVIGIIMMVLLGTIFLRVFGPFVFIFILLFGLSIFSARNKADAAEKEKQMLLGSTNNFNTVRSTNQVPTNVAPNTFYCYECGSPINKKQKFCSTCGDSTQDELKDALGYS